MTRYAVISAIAGSLDFLLALILLHMELAPWIAIAIAMVVSGVADYLALEWWGFRKRADGLSFKRLSGSALVEFITYLFRLAILWLWKTYAHDIDPTRHLVGLAVAYSISALVGYLMRTRIVFAGRNRSD